MPVTAIFANVSCRDLERSAAWYKDLFGRERDAAPMPGLNEWHRDGAGLQLHEDAAKAGNSTLTLIVDNLAAERRRLSGTGIETGEIEEADYTSVMRLSDPDGNLVVLAQPR